MFCELRERKYVMTREFTKKIDEKATKMVDDQFEGVMDLFRVR